MLWGDKAEASGLPARQKLEYSSRQGFCFGGLEWQGACAGGGGALGLVGDIEPENREKLIGSGGRPRTRTLGSRGCKRTE